MASIRVSPEMLSNAATKIAQQNENFLRASADLKRAADALAATWDGQDHDAFVREHEQIDRWYKRMSEVVAAYVAGMKQAASEYQEMDNEMASHIKG